MVMKPDAKTVKEDSGDPHKAFSAPLVPEGKVP